MFHDGSMQELIFERQLNYLETSTTSLEAVDQLLIHWLRAMNYWKGKGLDYIYINVMVSNLE